MTHSASPELSILVPAFNEAASLPGLQADLIKTLEPTGLSFEIIYCDDGSGDNTAELVRSWHQQDHRVKLIKLSRNFGKEYALSALIKEARGKALLSLDADGQHPVESIPQFIEAWRQGAQVVVGITKPYARQGLSKRLGTKIFYAIQNASAPQQLPAGSSDFRLISREVQQAFLQLPENDRMTRSLIDWVGFERVYLPYTTKSRSVGTAAYSNRMLINLAANSIVSISPRPLYLFGYLGVLITIGAGLLGLAVLVEQVIFEDPLAWDFTGNAMLGILILFLVGIVLMSQGILSLYVSSIQRQSKRRPLYIIDYTRSAGITATEHETINE